MRIFDAHVHLFDRSANIHPFLEREDPGFKAMAGDYSSLPHQYLTSDYLADAAAFEIEGFVWYEFLSTDPVKEAKWAQRLASASPADSRIRQPPLRTPMVAQVDFLDPDLEHRLETYAPLPDVVAVRQHLGWDADNPLRRFAKHPDLLSDPMWQRQLGTLRKHGFNCVLELFAPQLTDLPTLARLHPDINFSLGVMGWPLDLSTRGYDLWRHQLQALSHCKNVSIEIAAIECIFGMHTQPCEVAPWIQTILDLFGPNRIMFGSHSPIVRLSRGIPHLYNFYQQLTAPFSTTDRDNMFRKNASTWFTRASLP